MRTLFFSLIAIINIHYALAQTDSSAYLLSNRKLEVKEFIDTRNELEGSLHSIFIDDKLNLTFTDTANVTSHYALNRYVRKRDGSIVYHFAPSTGNSKTGLILVADKENNVAGKVVKMSKMYLKLYMKNYSASDCSIVFFSSKCCNHGSHCCSATDLEKMKEYSDKNGCVW